MIAAIHIADCAPNGRYILGVFLRSRIEKSPSANEILK